MKVDHTISSEAKAIVHVLCATGPGRRQMAWLLNTMTATTAVREPDKNESILFHIVFQKFTSIPVADRWHRHHMCA